MKTLSASLIAVSMFSIAAAIPAQAGKIVTPMLFLSNNTNQLICIATNASSSSINVKVKILGNLAGTGTKDCTLAAGDTDGCAAFLNDNAGHCRISISGMSDSDVRSKVRGVMFSRTTSAPFALEAVVEAR